MDGNTEYVITKLHGESDRSLGGQYPGMDWLHFEIERGQKKRCSSQGRSSASHLSQFVSTIRTCERWDSDSVEDLLSATSSARNPLERRNSEDFSSLSPIQQKEASYCWWRSYFK
jgi:hypothetical protein